jgi:hypothetical protein
MAMSEGGLMERLKGAATKVGAQGVRLVVDGTVVALRTVERLQELLPVREQGVRLGPEASPSGGERFSPDLERGRASTPVPLAEEAARASPRPRRKPARTESASQAGETPQARTAGRKTLQTPAPAPRQAVAKKKKGSKVKRGQKHRHS